MTVQSDRKVRVDLPDGLEQSLLTQVLRRFLVTSEMAHEPEQVLVVLSNKSFKCPGLFP